MINLLTFLIAFSAPVDLRLGAELVMGPIPEDNSHLLQFPTSVSMDDDGRTYVLDIYAKTVFVWDANGQFIGNIGSPGTGPGEFEFSENNIHQGSVQVVDNQILVYESGRNGVHVFDLDFEYIETRRFAQHPGRGKFFATTSDGTSLLYLQKNLAEGIPKAELSIYDAGLNPEVRLAEFAIRRYTLVKKGKYQEWNVNAFCPKYTLHAAPTSDEIVVGIGEKPEFSIYDTHGKKKTTVSFSLPRKMVSDDDKDEFLELKWTKHRPVSFPEYKPYFDKILPIGDHHYLVVSISPFYRDTEGVFINRGGEVRGKFQEHLGEQGNLHSVNGRLVLIKTDDEGSFSISIRSMAGKMGAPAGYSTVEGE